MDDDVVPYRHLTPLGRKLIDLWGGWKGTAYHPCIDGFYVTEPSKYDIHLATNAALHKLVEGCKTYEQALARNLHDDETRG